MGRRWPRMGVEIGPHPLLDLALVAAEYSQLPLLLASRSGRPTRTSRPVPRGKHSPPGFLNDCSSLVSSDFQPPCRQSFALSELPPPTAERARQRLIRLTHRQRLRTDFRMDPPSVLEVTEKWGPTPTPRPA